MPGVQVPKPFPEGRTFRDGVKLSDPPSTETFNDTCLACEQPGHKSVDCAAEIHTVADGTKRASMRYMYEKGHFTATGHKK